MWKTNSAISGTIKWEDATCLETRKDGTPSTRRFVVHIQKLLWPKPFQILVQMHLPCCIDCYLQSMEFSPMATVHDNCGLWTLGRLHWKPLNQAPQICEFTWGPGCLRVRRGLYCNINRRRRLAACISCRAKSHSPTWWRSLWTFKCRAPWAQRQIHACQVQGDLIENLRLPWSMPFHFKREALAM